MAPKDNPLFQDSTVSGSTNVRTQFEITKVFLNEGENLCLLLSDGKDPKILSMKCIDTKTGTYAASYWLKHRQEISYQYVVKNAEGVQRQSDIRKGLAMYTILEAWAQSTDSDILGTFSEEMIEETEVLAEENNESEDIIGNLIDKWGL